MKILISILFILSTITAQQKWNFYTTENSELPSNKVFDIEQDSEGNYWFATINGLAKFDGINWKVFDENDNPIFSENIPVQLSIDFSNRLYINFESTFAYLENGIWLIADTTQDNFPQGISCINRDTDGTLWVGTYYGGLYKYDGNLWHQLSDSDYNGVNPYPQDEVTSILIDNENNKWVGFHGMGLFKYNNTEWTKITSNYIFKEGSWETGGITLGSDESIWVSTLNLVPYTETKGYFLLHIGDQIEEFDSSFTNETVFPTTGGLQFDGREILWIALSNGLLRFDGTQFTEVNESNSQMPFGNIWSLEIDNHDNIWVSGAPNKGIAVYNENGIQGIPTSLNETTNNQQPTTFKLEQNYPNPFNPTTKIKYTIPNVGDAFNASRINVTLKVFDILGREVQTLVNKTQTPGNYEIEFDGSRLASGVYFYQLKAGDYISTKKMMLIK